MGAKVVMDVGMDWNWKRTLLPGAGLVTNVVQSAMCKGTDPSLSTGIIGGLHERPGGGT